MNSLREWEEAFEQAVDVKKSYDLAKRMEGPKTNPVLGCIYGHWCDLPPHSPEPPYDGSLRHSVEHWSLP